MYVRVRTIGSKPSRRTREYSIDLQAPKIIAHLFVLVDSIKLNAVNPEYYFSSKGL